MKLFENLKVNKIKASYSKININVDRFFLNLNEVQVYECLDTGYRFYYPPQIISDNTLYDDLQVYDWYYIPWKWENEQALNYLNSNTHLLDIGCGEGFFLEKIKGLVKESVGLEMNEEAAEKARRKKLLVEIQSIQNFATTNAAKYDVVSYFQVLEHIYDIHEFINSSLQCVKPGGKLIIGVPYSHPYLLINDKYHTLNLPPHHMGLWDEIALSNIPKVFPQLKLLNLHIAPADNADYFFMFRSSLISKFGDNLFSSFIKYLIGTLDVILLKKLLPPFYKNAKGKFILAIFERTT